jgi:hypothetical protein
VFLAEEFPLRRDDGAELVRAGEDRSDFVSFDIRDEIREHCRVGNRAAEQLQVLQIECSQIQSHDRASYRARRTSSRLPN